jgi:hypothetical protein
MRLFVLGRIGRGYFITSSQLISVTASAKATLHLSPSSTSLQHKNGLNRKIPARSTVSMYSTIQEIHQSQAAQNIQVRIMIQ